MTRSLYDAGYGSSSRLYERASAQLGMTPARYQKQGSGVTIHFTIAPTPIGKMLLAATDRGICSIHFGDAIATLESIAKKRKDPKDPYDLARDEAKDALKEIKKALKKQQHQLGHGN